MRSTPANDTKTRILDLAEDLLQRRGYTGFSYKDISQSLGIRNAAVHYHYAAKADLGVALVRRYRDLLRRRTAQFMSEGGDAVVQLEGYFAFTRRDTDDDLRICPVGMLSANFFTLPEAVQEEGKKLAVELIAWMCRVLDVGREQGAFQFVGPAEDKAITVLTTLQGARQMARFAGPSTLEAAIDQVRRDLWLR